MESKYASALIGGLAGGLIAALLNLPQNFISWFGCLAYAGCGLIAVWHYTNTHQLTITGGEGIGLGALAGVAGGLTGGLLASLFYQLGLMDPVLPQILEEMENTGTLDQMDPSTADSVISWLELASKWQVLIDVTCSVLFAVVFGLIGGAIGARIWKKGPDEPAM